MYHMVSEHRPNSRYNKLRVEPEQFERQLEWLRDNGWSFVFMSELIRFPRSQTVALTFDDGYRDNLLQADRLLQKYNAKATLYLVVDRHNRDWSAAKNPRHDDQELMNETKLSDDDVTLMIRSGRWELGAHTITHPDLPAQEDVSRRHEIVEGKRSLERQFSSAVDSFAYPFGRFELPDVHWVHEAGFRTAVTTRQGITRSVKANPLTLPRVKVSGRDGMVAFRLRMRTGKCRWGD